MSKTQREREAERKIYSEWQCTQCDLSVTTFAEEPDSTRVGETETTHCPRCGCTLAHLKLREWLE